MSGTIPTGEDDETCIKCYNAKSSSVQNTRALFGYVGLYFGLRIVNVEAFVVFLMLDYDLIFKLLASFSELLYLCVS